jgi:hypothetical protein
MAAQAKTKLARQSATAEPHMIALNRRITPPNSTTESVVIKNRNIIHSFG